MALAGCAFGRLVVSLWRLYNEPHADSLGRNLDPTDLAVDDGTNLLDIRFEFSFCNTGDVFTNTAEVLSFTASGDRVTSRCFSSCKMTYS